MLGPLKLFFRNILVLIIYLFRDSLKGLVGPEMGALVITHYQRILNYVKPDFVHVFVGGRIVEEGGPELAEKLEASGYEEWEEKEAA